MRLRKILAAALTAMAVMLVTSAHTQTASGRYGKAKLVETLEEKNIITEIAFFTEETVNVRHYIVGTGTDKKNLAVTLHKQDTCPVRSLPASGSHLPQGVRSFSATSTIIPRPTLKLSRQG